MRTKTGLVLKDVCGEKIVVAEGRENIDFTKIISMNDSAAYLWEKVQDIDFDVETLKSLLCDEYDVDEATALADSKTIANQWLEAGIIK